MDKVPLVEFANKAIFHKGIYSDKFKLYSRRTKKGRTLCFSIKKSVATEVQSVNFN